MSNRVWYAQILIIVYVLLPYMHIIIHTDNQPVLG